MKKKLALAALSVGLASGMAAQTQLPIHQDFTDYLGFDIHLSYPGWNEAGGLPPQPEVGEGAWYMGRALFGPAATINLDADYRQEWLISPLFRATEQSKLSFDAALTRFADDPAQGYFGFDDSLAVMVGINGQNYQAVFVLDQFSMLGPNMTHFEVPLGQFAGLQIKVGFFATEGYVVSGQAALHLDNISFKDAQPVDVLPLALLDPVWHSCLGQGQPVELRFKNDGTEPIANAELRVAVRGPANANLMTLWPETLAPGQIAVAEVGKADFSQPGTYHVELRYFDPLRQEWGTRLVQTIENPGLRELPLPTLDFTEFYTDNLPQAHPGWVEARGKNRPSAFVDTDWQAVSYQEQRTASVYFVNLGTEDWLLGPSIIPTENTVLRFKAAVETLPGYDPGMGADDKLALMVSTNCGLSWEQAFAIGASNAPGAGLQEFAASLAAYAGSTVRLALYATTGNVPDDQQYYFHIDDLRFYDQFAIDAGVSELLAPRNVCAFEPDASVVVRVANHGQQAIGGFPLRLTHNGQEYVETFEQSLAPGQWADYTFAQRLDMTLAPENRIGCQAQLQGDQNPGNDGFQELPVRLSAFDLASGAAFHMGFEPTDDFSAWAIHDLNDDLSTWTLLNSAEYSHDGTHSFIYSSNNSSTPSDDWLMSSCFTVEQGQEYRLSFHYRNRANNSPEKLKLTRGSSQDPQQQEDWLDLGSIANSAYLQATATFVAQESGAVFFGWNAYGEPDQFACHVDDIGIEKVVETDLALRDLRLLRQKDDDCSLLAITQAEAWVENKGSQAVEGFELAIQFAGQEPMSFPISQSLAPGARQWFSFGDPSWPIDPGQPIDFKGWLSFGQDQNASNDSLERTGVLPSDFQTDLERAETLADWTWTSLAGTSQWGRVQDQAVAFSGEHSFGIRTDAANGNTANDDYLFSECFHLEPGTCYRLAFRYRSRFSTENLSVHIGPQASTTGLQLLEDLGSFNSNEYLEKEIFLSVETPGAYHIAWRTQGGTSQRYWIYLDDIRLEASDASPVAQPSFELLDREVLFRANARQATSFAWDFGQGQTSDQPDASAFYPEDGSYTASLRVANSCASNDYELAVAIDCPLPSADFEVEALADGQYLLQAQALAAGVHEVVLKTDAVDAFCDVVARLLIPPRPA